ncbi:MAG: alpha-galactosidase [Clostridia bacterium]|nr:alpha-galactosidase [Clostridia bacterium]
MKSTKQDMALISAICPFKDPASIPVTYKLGETVYHGFPAEFSPVIERRRVSAELDEVVVTARTPDDLELKAICQMYLDFPVVDWVMYVTNKGTENSPVLSEWRINPTFTGQKPCLYHSNGDDCTPNGYTQVLDVINEEEPINIHPYLDGTSCCGAFPYMRLIFDGWGVNIAVGWTGTWNVDLTRKGDDVTVSAGQYSFASYLKPGETVRTPRMTYEAYAGTVSRGCNLWRSFYIAHILPKEDGQPLPPKLVLHTWMIDGLPEFCGVTEENQLKAIDTYLEGGLIPDIWWIDAGWYPCDNNWPTTGNWYPHPEHFPNGLRPVGEKCDDLGIQLLVWFEPERVHMFSDLWRDHPDFLLKYKGEHNDWYGSNALLNLGDPKVCDWLIDLVDGIIKESHIRIYRQDFNFQPRIYWDCNTEENRVGILENLHIQGYYRYWDALIARNPGLWMDSCASGGRRNDIETMRRAVPLHYTDVGYGDHHVKQYQHREMFEWIPYFRAHTKSWDNDERNYCGIDRPVDEFAFQNAMTPAITCMVEWNDSKEQYAIARRMLPIWRKAAALELSCDYYPLTVCRKDPSDWYAMQFDGENEGFIQVIRNIQVKTDSVDLPIHVDVTKTYTFTDPLGKRSFTASGAELARNLFNEKLDLRSGVIWFYTKQ